MNMIKLDYIIQIGNLIPDARFNNTHRGRVYAVYGIAPTVYNYAGGGGLHAKVLIERDL